MVIFTLRMNIEFKENPSIFNSFRSGKKVAKSFCLGLTGLIWCTEDVPRCVLWSQGKLFGWV